MSTPTPETAAVDLAALRAFDRLLTGHGIQYLIYGGWGLDIICGRQSRPHRDLDLFCWRHDYQRLRSLLARNGISGYELPGVHLAVKAPLRADIVFLDAAGTDWITGTASSFQVRLPRGALTDWTHGIIDGHRLPVGCVELVVRLCGYSPHSRPGDRRLIEAIAARCDRAMLAAIERTGVPYDRGAVWQPLVTPDRQERSESPRRNRAAGR